MPAKSRASVHRFLLTLLLAFASASAGIPGADAADPGSVGVGHVHTAGALQHQSEGWIRSGHGRAERGLDSRGIAIRQLSGPWLIRK
jgi:hypothetical protein